MAAKHSQPENSYNTDKAWIHLAAGLKSQTSVDKDTKREKRHLSISLWHGPRMISGFEEHSN